MRIGEVFRYARPNSAYPFVLDGLPNFFAATGSPGHKLVKIDAGINPIERVQGTDGARCPAILIRSSPHKRGSVETPWHDTFEPDEGFVIYYGDNKSNAVKPELAPGNKTLLAQFQLHTSADPDERARSVPILLWEGARHQDRVKGNVAFMGLGVLTAGELVTQFSPRTREYFSNYRWELAVLTLKHENEHFSWDWITRRRDSGLTTSETLISAPQAWRDWIRHGALETCRRRVVRYPIASEAAQRVKEGHPDVLILNTIYKRYAHSRARFENLASFVCAAHLRRQGVRFTEGWVTPPGGDGGIDFVGRIDIGSGWGACRVILLGQAKCEQLDVPTNGQHVARTVARLRRGWIGAYVTTRYFSEKVQREIANDEYPVVLMGGKQLADEVRLSMNTEGFDSLDLFPTWIDSQYERMLSRANPDAILRELFTCPR